MNFRNPSPKMKQNHGFHLTYSAGTESIVENTVFRISDNEYVALMYGGVSPKEKDFYRLVRLGY